MASQYRVLFVISRLKVFLTLPSVGHQMYLPDRSLAPRNTQKTIHTAQRNIESITARAGSCLPMKTLVSFRFAVVYYVKASKSSAESTISVLFCLGVERNPWRWMIQERLRPTGKCCPIRYMKYSEFQIGIFWSNGKRLSCNIYPWLQR